MPDLDQLILFAKQYGVKGAALYAAVWLGKTYALPWLKDRKLSQYALKAIRLARNIANGSGLAMTAAQVERLAVKQFRKLAGKAAKKLDDEFIRDLLRITYEAERERQQKELNKWNADIETIAKRNRVELERLKQASAAADALNESRMPSNDAGGQGAPTPQEEP